MRTRSKSCHAAGFTLRYRQFHYPKLDCPMPNALCPLLLKAYTRSECATLVQWFKVELAIKLNKTANGV